MNSEEVSQICVADPYYMHESFLSLGDFERETARDYLQNFMVQNKDRKIVLVPYHPNKLVSNNPFIHFNHSFSLYRE